MTTSFKTSLFGGFDREDVIAFIERTSSVNQEKLGALGRENETLKASNEELTQKVKELEQQLALAADGGPVRRELEQQLAELEAKTERLEQEAQELRQQAQEYQTVKNHIADIEISAHRRTEEFRRETIRQLRELLAGQRAWCEAAKQRYSAQNDALLQQLQEVQHRFEGQLDNAREEIASYTPDTFDQLEQQLSALVEQLKED